MQPRHSETSFRSVVGPPTLHLLAALALLAGCATYEPKPLVPAEMAAAYEQRSLEAPELRAFLKKQLGLNDKSPLGWPRHWDREVFTLAAFFYHPSLDVARAQLEAAKAAEISASSRPNPMASLSPSYNFDGAPGLPRWIPGLDVDVPIETAGKRGLRHTLARHRTEVARLNLYSTAWKLRAGVRDSMVQYDYQARLAIRLHVKLGAQKELLERMEASFKAGATSQAEVSAARVAHEKTQLEASLAEEASRDSLNRLAAAIGVPPRYQDYPTRHEDFPRWPDLKDAASVAVQQAALQNRADLRIALAEYAVSQAALQVEIAKQYPDIHLGSGYQWDQGDSKWTLFKLSLDLPLLNRNQGPIAEARAKREEAAARFTELQSQAIADIGRATRTFLFAQGRNKMIAPLYEAQRQQGQLLEAKLTAGIADSIDLVQLRIEQVSTSMLISEINYRAEIAIGQLEDALQMPLIPSGKPRILPTGQALGDLLENRPRDIGKTP